MTLWFLKMKQYFTLIYLRSPGMKIPYFLYARHCGLDPQSPENKEILKQTQHDGESF